ncbi:MAG TPA: glycoside hydrolase family 32 protein [Propionicimonas sp.]
MSNELHRPRSHFTPARNWMNDPNGLVFYEGTYHLFFQYNPAGPDWGNMSWGHATSADLVSWTEQPVAIPHTPSEQIFSGSVVVDHENTSGFGDGGEPPFVAVYTSAYATGLQAQSLAISLDLGHTWTRHAENPVLDRDSSDFRDPKVVRLADRDGRERWIMLAVEAVRRQVLIYSSDDLRAWTFESAVGPLGPEGVVWECPDLFALDVDGDPARRKWVLLISTNPPDLSADSSTVYLVGDFDGHTFTPDAPEDWPVVDHGRDFYAATSFANLPSSRPLILGWAGNWQYAAHIPTRPWRGMMTLPRELTLRTRDGALALVQEIPCLSGFSECTSLHYGPTQLAATASFSTGLHYVLDLVWDVGDAEVVGVDLLVGTGTRTRLAYHPARAQLILDRTQSGQVDFHRAFASIVTAPVPLRDGRVAVRVVVDGSLIEVLADQGAVTLTNQVFPDESADDAVFFAQGSTPTLTARHCSLGG